MNAAAVIKSFSFHEELNLTDLLNATVEQCKAAHGGDLKRAESTLMAQAISLDVMFTSLARGAHRQDGLKQHESLMKLALKAQSQCRATIETLAAIKNPPVFAKQANIAHGPQQVNNEAAPAFAHARAQQIESKPNELLEHEHGKWLDTRTAAATSGSDQAMATVEEVHRSAHKGRKGKRQP
ncbi:MAG: hypothetical protein KGL42_16790 [Betaproteobacteria bacterium]|nr:hypothetical protein [Betaproteobacteria bacterium]